MCGRLNTYARSVSKASTLLEVKNPEEQIFKRFIRATDKVSIIRQKNNERNIVNASWWLLQERAENGFKPSKYTSFNTRYDKLNIKGSAGFQAYRESRCIIPAKGFGETEFVNKKPIHYYDFTVPEGEFICFGGLYREWFNKDDVLTSCSVITLPPHEKLKGFHSKASPLMLPFQYLEQWLDPKIKKTSQFDKLLIPNIPHELIVQKIDKPSTHQAINEEIKISHD